MSDLRTELEAALVILREEDAGVADPFTDKIAEALKANTAKAMKRAAALWREYHECCPSLAAGIHAQDAARIRDFARANAGVDAAAIAFKRHGWPRQTYLRYLAQAESANL